MIRSLWISKTGLDAQQTQMDVIANNLANVSTNGFKRSRAVFEDLLYQTLRQPGAQSSQQTQLPSGLQVGTGVSAGRNRTGIHPRQFAADRKLQGCRDPGPGILPGADAGWHDSLYPGRLVSVRFPGSARDIQRLSDSAEHHHSRQRAEHYRRPRRHGFDHPAGFHPPVEVGTLQLATFINPVGLQSVGENFYVETFSSGPPNINSPGIDGAGMLNQGYVETSNVNVVEELVNMIQTQRAYEINSKAIQTSDQMLQRLTQM